MCRVAQGLILALDGFASMLIQARVSAITFLILPFESRTIQILVQRVVWLSFVLWRPFLCFTIPIVSTAESKASSFCCNGI